MSLREERGPDTPERPCGNGGGKEGRGHKPRDAWSPGSLNRQQDAFPRPWERGPATPWLCWKPPGVADDSPGRRIQGLLRNTDASAPAHAHSSGPFALHALMEGPGDAALLLVTPRGEGSRVVPHQPQPFTSSLACAHPSGAPDVRASMWVSGLCFHLNPRLWHLGPDAVSPQALGFCP